MEKLVINKSDICSLILRQKLKKLMLIKKIYNYLTIVVNKGDYLL